MTCNCLETFLRLFSLLENELISILQYFFIFVLFSFLTISANILQPTNTTLMQPMSTNPTESNSHLKPTTLSMVGQTWSNAGPINIDLDNLLSPKSKSTGPSLSMNQLKLQSPVKTQTPSTFPIQPTTPSQTSAAHINTNLANNNNFNSSINNNFGATNQFAGNNQSLSGFGNLLSNTMNPTTNNLSNQFNAFQ